MKSIGNRQRRSHANIFFPEMNPIPKNISVAKHGTNSYFQIKKPYTKIETMKQIRNEEGENLVIVSKETQQDKYTQR